MHLPFFKSSSGSDDTNGARSSKSIAMRVRASQLAHERLQPRQTTKHRGESGIHKQKPASTEFARPEVVLEGSTNPCFPEKTSTTRRTVHPDCRDPSAGHHFRDFFRDFSPNTEAAGTDQEHRLLPKRSTGLRHPAPTRRRSNSAPNDAGTWTRQNESVSALPKRSHHHKSYSLPVSKFNPSTDALGRTARETANLTASAAKKYNNSEHTSKVKRDIPAAVDDNPMFLTHEGPHDIVSGSGRADRHRANKRLYYKMKAENHNLWVLLDASNRRANMMMETLHAEEQRCQSLEQRSRQLQANLDTLNARRLWQQEEAASRASPVRDSDNTLGAPTIPDYSDSASEAAQVTAELDNLRRNLAQSRNAIRDLQSGIEPIAPLSSEALRPTQSPEGAIASQEVLENSIHQILGPHISRKRQSITSLAMIDQLDSKLQHLVEPKPIRPARTAGSSQLSPVSTHDSSAARPDEDSGSGTHTDAGTPELSLTESNRSSFESVPSTNMPATPPPPPKSTRRVDTMSHIHPALRTDTSAKATEEIQGRTGKSGLDVEYLYGRNGVGETTGLIDALHI